MDSPLFQRLVAQLRPFFNNRADEFARRQCAQAKIAPELLMKKDIPFLAYWASTSAKLVLSKENAELLYRRIMSLAE